MRGRIPNLSGLPPMITLYTAATPNCQKILIFLEEVGLDSEMCRVDATKNTFDNQ